MEFAYPTERVGTDTVFHLAGELDLAYRDALAATLIAALPEADTVITDPTNLTFIDAFGVGVTCVFT